MQWVFTVSTTYVAENKNSIDAPASRPHYVSFTFCGGDISPVESGQYIFAWNTFTLSLFILFYVNLNILAYLCFSWIWLGRPWRQAVFHKLASSTSLKQTLGWLQL